MKKIWLLLISFFIFPMTYNALNNAQVNNLVEACNGNCYRIKNMNEAKEKYREIIYNKNPGTYYLYYADEDNFNTNEFFAFFNTEYLSDKKTNTYRFADYGIFKPIKYSPIIGANYLRIDKDGYSVRSKQLEQALLVADYITFFYKDETDLNKLLLAYTYVSQAKNDDASIFGVYNVLVDRKGNERSKCSFQLLMEKFGFESYIVDTDYTFDDNNRTYSNEGSYVIVKFHSNWYTVSFDGNLLKGTTNNNYYNMTSNLKYDVSNTNYPLVKTSYEIDNFIIEPFITDVKNNTLTEEKRNVYFRDDSKTVNTVIDVSPEIDQPQETKDQIGLVVGAILILITVVVIISVKKK